MMSAGIRDFALLFPDIKINAKGNHAAIWENNPYLDANIKEDDPNVEVYRIGYPAIGSANNTYIHFSSMFLLDIIAIVDHHKSLNISLGEFCSTFSNGQIGDPALGSIKKNRNAKEPFISLQKKYHGFCQKFSRMRGDLHLTEKEKNNNIIKEIYGYEKYAVVAPGGKRDCTAKIYDWRKFQSVIDYFDGLIKFVVIGKADLLVEKLNNVIDLVSKFDKNLRGLFSLVYNADICVSGPSALMHISAAIPPKRGKARKPCVVIMGSREPLGWIDYTGHQTLHNNGVFDCGDPACWKARTIPLQKDPKHNKNLCKRTVQDDGRTIQACMASITAQDVTRGIEKYYAGNIYTYLKKENSVQKMETTENIEDTTIKLVSELKKERPKGKEINLLGNLHTKGGGEQSLVMIAKLLQKAGWKVYLFPMSSVHENFANMDINIQKYNFQTMAENMKEGLPLLFYANDSVRKFCDEGQKIVDKSCSIIVAINYINRPLPNCQWLSKSGKVRGIIFQNQEKMSEFKRDQIGFKDTKLICLYGAIDLEKYLEVCPAERKDSKGKLVILKHSCPDNRKYVTKSSINKGNKTHLWQKQFHKELDTKFYKRLLKDVNNAVFMFMQAPDELRNYFQHENRMIFLRWDEIPVPKFLSMGHVYLYRVSDDWVDNYPRCMAEALAAGLPCIGEPRYGTKDRIVHGDTGFYGCQYDEYALHLRTLQRKEGLRQKMGEAAKTWAKANLDPRKWCDVIEELVRNK